MQIIKLNRRYMLGREGFSHAVVFTANGDPYLKKKAVVEKILYDMYGDGKFYYNSSRTLYGKESHKWAKYTQVRNATGIMQWFIGVKEESMLSAILLMVD